MTQQYIPCQVITDITGKRVPVWECDYVNIEFGDTLSYNGCHYDRTVTMLYDLKAKAVFTGTVVDHLPHFNPGHPFKVGTRVGVPAKATGSGSSYKLYRPDTIVDISYKEYGSNVTQVKELDVFQLNQYFNAEQQAKLQPDDWYEIRTWKPIYKLSNGEVVLESYYFITLTD